MTRDPSSSIRSSELAVGDELPAFDLTHWETPSPSNPLGVKGCGEAGAAAAPPAVINAIVDALAPRRVRHVDMPATPGRIWAAITSAGGAAAGNRTATADDEPR